MSLSARLIGSDLADLVLIVAMPKRWSNVNFVVMTRPKMSIYHVYHQVDQVDDVSHLRVPQDQGEAEGLEGGQWPQGSRGDFSFYQKDDFNLS